jgi:NTP pyrophosphatase (non-canonical NTP hydrolase)
MIYLNYQRKGETTIKKEITVGTEVDAYCTKCRLILNHVVVAMVGKRPKKVECLTCHSQHVYRASEPGSRAKAAPSTATSAVSKQDKEIEKKRAKLRRLQEKEKELWKETLAKKDLAIVKPYTMADSYEIEDVINHNKFGMGIVTHLITPQKMEVLFEDGYKCMVCNFSQ